MLVFPEKVDEIIPAAFFLFRLAVADLAAVSAVEVPEVAVDLAVSAAAEVSAEVAQVAVGN